MLLLPPLVPDDRALSSANDDDKISDDVNPDPFGATTTQQQRWQQSWNTECERQLLKRQANIDIGPTLVNNDTNLTGLLEGDETTPVRRALASPRPTSPVSENQRGSATQGRTTT